MSTALLIEEPEPEARGFLERHLADDGFELAAPGMRPDLVVLGDPSAIDRYLGMPLIVLGSSDADAVDRVRALERGCDDYLARPFHYDELLARIRAVLRRVAPPEPDRLVAAEIVVDRPTRRVTVSGTPVALAGKEYELLLKLASDPARVFTKEQLLREVWGFRSLGRTRTLDSHASRLRRKLGAANGGAYVHNVWGVGYCLLGQ